MDKPTIYRRPMGENLFEEEFTIEALSQMGNPLERLSSLVDFEMFRPVLEEVLLTKECKTPAGRKPIDVYDLNGRKQSAVNFKKGIYIINGKKYLVK